MHREVLVIIQSTHCATVNRNITMISGAPYFYNAAMTQKKGLKWSQFLVSLRVEPTGKKQGSARA